MAFELIQGVDVTDLSGINSAYLAGEGYIDAVLSAELIRPTIEALLKLLDEPHFFYLELPCDEKKENELRKTKRDPLHIDVYYLDNCTREVSLAILDRYGELLINDGLVRFGFGSHKTNEEINVLKYQQLVVYGDGKYAAAFDGLGVKASDELRTMWDNFTPDTPGTCMSVEIEGEKIYDLPELLKDAGMYFAETREE